MKVYGHLQGYLHRWRLCGVGRLMVRVHRILTPDLTPFLHTHPFAYVSIVLRGGYDERVQQADGSLKLVRRRAGSIAVRSARSAHRIDAVHGACTTLFITWRVAGTGQGWGLWRHPEVAAPAGYVDAPDGLYPTAGGFRRREGGIWFAKRATAAEAARCDRISLHQE